MKGHRKPGQTVCRIPPCPAYDIAGMENWLSDLAEEGLFLTQDGFFAGLAILECREPQKAKYRLEAAQKQGNLWSEEDSAPDPEQIELSEKYAWEYVAKRGGFFIYRSMDASARELNTDPEVQALALNAVKRRQRGAVISSILRLVVYPLLMIGGCPILAAVSVGTWWIVLGFLFAALMIAGEIRAFVHLRKVQRSLTENGCYEAGTGRRKRAVLYFLGKIAKTVLALVLLVSILRIWGLSAGNENKIPLDEYDGDLPFATLRDFAGEGCSDYTVTMTGLGLSINTVEESADWIAPRCISFNEHASVKTAAGDRLDGGLYVDYYQLRSDHLAKELATELFWFDRVKRRVKPLDTPELPADWAACYMNEVHWPTVIFRKGNVVIRAYFYQTSDSYKMPMEEWMEILCRSAEK